MWQQVEACKQALPKDSTYQNLTASQLQQQLPVWVISLRRATERRQNMVLQLKQAGALRAPTNIKLLARGPHTVKSSVSNRPVKAALRYQIVTALD